MTGLSLAMLREVIIRKKDASNIANSGKTAKIECWQSFHKVSQTAKLE